MDNGGMDAIMDGTMDRWMDVLLAVLAPCWLSSRVSGAADGSMGQGPSRSCLVTFPTGINHWVPQHSSSGSHSSLPSGARGI